MDKVLPWKVSSDELIASTVVFNLRKVRAHSQMRSQTDGDFVYLDTPNWVNVIALTASDEVVLVEQYRHGNRKITLEIPGGMCDDDEDFIVAGLRELVEETGYVGEGVDLIGIVEPNPAIQNNKCGTVLIRNVRLVHKQELDPMEEIRILTKPISEIPDLIRKGDITNSLVIAAFHHFHLLSSD
jgi:8-oxo-dGTP pyrophosphatase MutT (NUDIX family)